MSDKTTIAMKRRHISTTLFLFIALLFSCKEAPPVFQHDLPSSNQPWTKSQFDNDSEKFSFIVHSDLTGGERPRIYDVAVEQMNLLRPEFIVNVGDLIEGGKPDSTSWIGQWDEFDERANKAKAPVFYTGGNHDLTGNFAHGIWEKRYGRSYYHFLYKNTLFLVLDSDDHGSIRNDEIEKMRNEGIRILEEEGEEAYAKTDYANLPERSYGNMSEEQRDYFLEVLQKYPDVKWTFLMMHKPMWDSPQNERFAALEERLTGKNYTVFNGHTHTFNYQVRKGMDYINLATTGGAQNNSRGRSMDHFLWITVDNEGISIANLLMEGILNRQGFIPAGGDTLVFEKK
ncbi:metallophosphoesterase family protein [Algoriphagus namhaensis]|uniref:Metallophosphoesterase family protein n=1 Tax=Algoriphagus namhaensis TaxID=915353 RepID=A0ABV8APD4_9BACT